MSDDLKDKASDALRDLSITLPKGWEINQDAIKDAGGYWDDDATDSLFPDLDIDSLN